MRIIIVMLFSMVVASAAIQRGKISFQALSAGDEIVVRYETEGCFHQGQYEFTFSRGTKYRVDVERIITRWNKRAGRWEGVDRIYTGRINLSETDIKGLDSLFSFYRGLDRGGCTTEDHITITQHSKDGVEVREKYVDGTCDTHMIEGILTFGEIVGRCEGKER